MEDILGYLKTAHTEHLIYCQLPRPTKNKGPGDICDPAALSPSYTKALYSWGSLALIGKFARAPPPHPRPIMVPLRGHTFLRPR